MNRAEDEIEFVPVLFHPASAGGGSLWIVIELDPRANFHVGISRAQFFDLIEINSRVIAIVIGERDVAQSNRARVINPRLQQLLRVRLHPVSLRMHVIIGKKFHFVEALVTSALGG